MRRARQCLEHMCDDVDDAEVVDLVIDRTGEHACVLLILTCRLQVSSYKGPVASSKFTRMTNLTDRFLMAYLTPPLCLSRVDFYVRPSVCNILRLKSV